MGRTTHGKWSGLCRTLKYIDRKFKLGPMGLLLPLGFALFLVRLLISYHNSKIHELFPFFSYICFTGNHFHDMVLHMATMTEGQLR